jgi:predicted ATPase
MAKVVPCLVTPSPTEAEHKAADVQTRLASEVFVGREREMQVLRTAFIEADAGRERLVLLTGEPGIGKTRLASELAAHARLHGAQVFISRCYEDEGAPPFWPWVQIVRGAIGARPPNAPSGDGSRRRCHRPGGP